MKHTELPPNVSYQEYSDDEVGAGHCSWIIRLDIPMHLKYLLLAMDVSYGMGGAPADPEWYRKEARVSPEDFLQWTEELEALGLIRLFPGDPSSIQMGWWRR